MVIGGTPIFNKTMEMITEPGSRSANLPGCPLQRAAMDGHVRNSPRAVDPGPGPLQR